MDERIVSASIELSWNDLSSFSIKAVLLGMHAKAVFESHDCEDNGDSNPRCRMHRLQELEFGGAANAHEFDGF